MYGYYHIYRQLTDSIHSAPEFQSQHLALICEWQWTCMTYSAWLSNLSVPGCPLLYKGVIKSVHLKRMVVKISKWVCIGIKPSI